MRKLVTVKERKMLSLVLSPQLPDEVSQRQSCQVNRKRDLDCGFRLSSMPEPGCREDCFDVTSKGICVAGKKKRRRRRLMMKKRK